jgi:hypothetical protein
MHQGIMVQAIHSGSCIQARCRIPFAKDFSDDFSDSFHDYVFRINKKFFAGGIMPGIQNRQGGIGIPQRSEDMPRKSLSARRVTRNLFRRHSESGCSLANKFLILIRNHDQKNKENL